MACTTSSGGEVGVGVVAWAVAVARSATAALKPPSVASALNRLIGSLRSAPQGAPHPDVVPVLNKTCLLVNQFKLR